MDLNMRKEQFSRAYVQAVAACAGYAWSSPSVDDDSVDITLHERGGRGTVRSPKLELQLKCKEAPIPNEPAFSFFVPIKNYDDLREVSLAVPRILVVVLVPEDPNEWLKQSEEELAMRRCGYWISLRGLQPSGNQTGQTVHLSRTQSFSVLSLTEMMQRIGQGELP